MIEEKNDKADKGTEMKTYSDMTFEELLKYKVRLIDDGVWSEMSIDEKKDMLRKPEVLT